MAFVYCTNECIGCMICSDYCPSNAIGGNDQGCVVFNQWICASCNTLDCEAVCPTDCIIIEYNQQEEPAQIVNESYLYASMIDWFGTAFDASGGTRTAQGSTDCSGMIWGIFRDLGYNYAYCSTGYFGSSPNWVQVSSPQNGDIAVWAAGHHCGIYYQYNGYNLYSARSAGVNWGQTSWWTNNYGPPKYYRYKR